jgi:macrolide-specific efflux system membrane fusion protein
LIPGALAAIALGGTLAGAACSKEKAAAYRTVAPERGDIRKFISTTGTVEPRNRLEIKPTIAGRVESVLVVEGQAVRRGQLLAWMSSTERAALIDAARMQGEAELGYWENAYKPTPIIAPSIVSSISASFRFLCRITPNHRLCNIPLQRRFFNYKTQASSAFPSY